MINYSINVLVLILLGEEKFMINFEIREGETFFKIVTLKKFLKQNIQGSLNLYVLK